MRTSKTFNKLPSMQRGSSAKVTPETDRRLQERTFSPQRDVQRLSETGRHERTFSEDITKSGLVGISREDNVPFDY